MEQEIILFLKRHPISAFKFRSEHTGGIETKEDLIYYTYVQKITFFEDNTRYSTNKILTANKLKIM